MAVVLPFLKPTTATGWSAAERARLSLLTERLPAAEAGLEVVFGVSDSGDPWCVVQDRLGDVLIHVARIDGRFLVHHAAEDILREGAELWGVLLGLLQAPHPPELEAEVIPFDLRERKAQALIALLTVAALYAEAASGGEFEPAQAPSLDDAAPPPGGDSAAPAAAVVLVAASSRRSEAAALVAAVEEPEPATPPETTTAQASADDPPPAVLGFQQPLVSMSAAQPPEPRIEPAEIQSVARAAASVIAGTASDDRLAGTAEAEVLLGGDGDDVLAGGGAPEGFVDVLLGGRGDDRLAVNAAVVAAGGEGADRFVFDAVAVDGAGPVFLGVVLDFAPGEGDVLDFSWAASEARVLSTAPVTDVLAAATARSSEPAPPAPGFRVALDLDGDLVEDAFVLLAGSGLPPETLLSDDGPPGSSSSDAPPADEPRSFEAWTEPMPPSADGLLC